MKIKLYYCWLWLFFFPPFGKGWRWASAQDTSQYYDNSFLRYEDFIYKKNIHTVQCQKADWEFSAPVIRLGTNDKIKLAFDDFDTDSKNYRFTIIHCDANWVPTTHLLQSEYINGFLDDNIIDYQYSKSTVQRYVHYELLFPTENLKPTLSGNYILKIFLDYDQNNLILTRRFMVMDERVNILPNVHRPSIIEDYDYKQEVDFTIQKSDYQITNPYQDLKVVLMQNDRYDNAITTLKPLFIKDVELTYDYDKDNVFPGGNEFRAFDVSSVRWLSERVQNIIYEAPKPPDPKESNTDSTLQGGGKSGAYHVYLYPDKRRNYLKYFSDVDKDGKFKINRTESSQGTKETEAEYVYVHFSVPMSDPVTDGGIYVFGGMTEWKYSNDFKMKYNRADQAYQLTLYLKQGYYNYEYVYLKDNEKVGDESFVEGSHYETENDYALYVYYHPMSGNYDQLIGMKRFNSIRY
ncbi:MAG: DUF5103 domain-containing protein [Bacteroidetes bacterium]|nr:DUF5103 domain-containing protein [Bacteroidota bacterium]